MNKFHVSCRDCDSEVEINVVESEEITEPFVCPMCGSPSIKVKEIDED
jgi:hypothetical protein